MSAINELVDSACTDLARQLDDEINRALNHHWGFWSLDDARRRCRMVLCDGSQVEVLQADGVPLLEIHPIESTTERRAESVVIRYNRNVRRLYDPEPSGNPG